MRRLISIAFALSLLVVNVHATEPAKYIAKLSEDSTNITAYVIENTLGTVTWSKIEEGRYRMSCAGCFPDETKVVGLRSFHLVTSGKYYVYWDDEGTPGDALIIQTYNSSGVLSDNILSVNDFSIVVYP